MSRLSEGQSHSVLGYVCEYEVNQLTNENVIRGIQTLTQIVYDTGRPLSG